MKKYHGFRILGWGALCIGLLFALSFNTSCVYPRSKDNKETQPKGASIIGVLLAEDDSPQVETEVRLIIVRLVGLDGKEILNLPPINTYIIDSDGKAVKVAETDSSGKFEFKDVQPDRYSLVIPRAGGMADQLWLKESTGNTVFFDIIGTQKVELGRLKAGKP